MENYRSYCPNCDKEYTWQGYKTGLGKSNEQLEQMNKDETVCKHCHKEGLITVLDFGSSIREETRNNLKLTEMNNQNFNTKSLGAPGTVMTKVHKYKGFDFGIKVKFESSRERHVGGKVFDDVCIDDMGEGFSMNNNVYHRMKRVERHELIAMINLFINHAEMWVDERITANSAISELQKLGFS